MSIVDDKDQSAECVEHPGSGIARVIDPRQKDLGGFSVRRVLPVAGQRMVGPWIFFDHMGPADFSPGKGIDVRPHPHINLATVTYLFDGEILHRDSLGNVQIIRPGDVNLMVAGRGIVHSERETPEVRGRQHSLHGLQLWLALPEADEEIEPSFQHYPAADLPAAVVNGVTVKVIMGTAFGVTSPVRTFAQTLYMEAELASGQTLQLPDHEQRAVYVAQGQITVNGAAVATNSMAVLTPGVEVVICSDIARSSATPQASAAPQSLDAHQTSRVAVVGGESLGSRFIDWNFVSSRKARIDQAKADWQAGRFPKVPGDDIEFIPLPS